ncbi:MAG: TonB-dependent receptor, partial [Candidatus Eremiobacteraeota bacterium]|nr:TonB-dependent receptor [Candidatus Eremiobacteraeota bacterium]
AQVQSYNELQPRLAGTYTVNADTVLRASIGKYAEPPNAAFEQYNALQNNLPGVLGKFVPFGFNTPGHRIVPATSINADFSYEHRFHNTDWSMKLSPFIRKTKDQIQQFFLDQKSGFVSGLNVGRQTSEGVEFQLNKGDFSRNGLSGQFGFTYTHSFVDYDKLANGNTVFSGINNDITAFNALTGAGGGAKCYTGGGTADPACAAGSFANPYYNSPLQSQVGTTGVPTYDLLPGPVGASAVTYGAPYFATFILNYKHDKFTITPTVQFQGGSRYASPESNYGIDPTAGCSALAGTNSANDPRYATFGGVSGVPGYDATTCANVIPVPNFYTGKFDQLGAFVQPSQLLANLQMSYQVSPKLTLVGTFANVVNTCFGGTKAAWTRNDHNVCSYGIVGAGSIPPVGNVFNPGSTIQPFVQYPYLSNLGAVNVDGASTKTPFNFFLEARIKI